MDRRYTATACEECGDPWCAGCEDADVDRDEVCDHTDKRVCEGLGHAVYSEDGQSGPF